MNKIKAFYFSPTGTTEKIVTRIAEDLATGLNLGGFYRYDFTLSDSREGYPVYSEDDLVVVGVPVYAGRIPNVLLKYLKGVNGNGARAVAVVLYGNRDYDHALLELKDILLGNDFRVIAAGAFIGEHSFSGTLAEGRPDKQDMEIASNFAEAIIPISGRNGMDHSIIKGDPGYKDYYQPLDEEGKPVDIRKVKPKTKSSCIDCKICSEVCPMGSIPEDNVKVLTGICIKCGACIKRCPVGAKYFDDEDYLRHKWELEENCKMRREPEIFI